MHKTILPQYFLSDLSLKRNNLSPEASDVNTINDEFIKTFNDAFNTLT